MRCFMCFNSDIKLQTFQGDKDDNTFKRIMTVLPDLVFPESQDLVLICATCLEQVSFFYTIKKTSLHNCWRLKQFNAMLKGSDNFKYNELSIKINSEEESAQLKCHIEIKVEPNHEDLFLSEDTDPTHVLKEETVYVCNRQQLEYEKFSSSSNISTQSYTNMGSYEFVDMNKFTENDSNLMPSDSRHEDQPEIQHGSQEKRFKCTDCDKAFTCRSDLERHIRDYTGEKPFKCTICHKTFTRVGHLNTHKFIHTGEKPHKCDICHKTFNHKSNLIYHNQIHNNVRPFQCAVCSKRFTRTGDLKAHMLTHTGEKAHQCHLCEYKCATAGNLKKHIRCHTGEKPYSCKHCEKTFKRRSNLKRHELRLHSNEDLD